MMIGHGNHAGGLGKMDGRHIVIAWNEWADSEEGRTASNPHTLPPTENARQYLVNRLERAFQAGVKAAEKARAPTPAPPSQ